MGKAQAGEAALLERKFGQLIDAQGLLKSVFLAKLAGAPIAGFDRNSAREGLSALFYRDRYAVARDLHAISRTRLLFGAALGYRVEICLPENASLERKRLMEAYGAVIHYTDPLEGSEGARVVAQDLEGV